MGMQAVEIENGIRSDLVEVLRKVKRFTWRLEEVRRDNERLKSLLTSMVEVVQLLRVSADYVDPDGRPPLATNVRMDLHRRIMRELEVASIVEKLALLELGQLD